VMVAAAAVTPTNSRRPTPVSFESLIELVSSVGRLEPRTTPREPGASSMSPVGF
jgi:hypothetical protein